MPRCPDLICDGGGTHSTPHSGNSRKVRSHTPHATPHTKQRVKHAPPSSTSQLAGAAACASPGPHASDFDANGPRSTTGGRRQAPAASGASRDKPRPPTHSDTRTLPCRQITPTTGQIVGGWLKYRATRAPRRGPYPRRPPCPRSAASTPTKAGKSSAQRPPPPTWRPWSLMPAAPQTSVSAVAARL